jgi:hypothetical protein
MWLSYRMDNLGNEVRLPACATDSSLLQNAQTDLGPTQPLIKLVLGALSYGESVQGVKLTIHLVLN